MAIGYARARFISRSSGGNAVAYIAYVERSKTLCERTGEVFDFRGKGNDVLSNRIILPEGAVELDTSHKLWNAAENAETRRNSQVAREVVLALPRNPEISDAERVEIAEQFAKEHFADHGLAVQVVVHRGQEGDENPHAHLVISTRRQGPEGFGAKARDLNPEVRKGRVTEGELYGELWRHHQNRYFRENEIPLQVDEAGIHPGEHFGPARMRGNNPEVVARMEALRMDNLAAARDPEQVLQVLTRNSSTFTDKDLRRFVEKNLPDEAERMAVTVKVLEHPDTIQLDDAKVHRFTTKAVRDTEIAALSDAAALAKSRHRVPTATATSRVLIRLKLRPDQKRAFEAANSEAGLVLIAGRAGTGKSHTLTAVRQAQELIGKRVVGLAPTNVVSRDMAKDGFHETSTIHSALWNQQAPSAGRRKGPASWDRRTVLIVDEAAMVDSKTLGLLLGEACKAGAKVVLTGDDRQLASVEAGGMFTVLAQRHGSAVIDQVVRQSADWQREASKDLSEGRFAAALEVYDQAGAVTWAADAGGAKRELIRQWAADRDANPDQSRFVVAHTNADVSDLNAMARKVRQDRGEIGRGVILDTKHGPAEFSRGDKIQIIETIKPQNLINGQTGTIVSADRGGRVVVDLDGGGQRSWNADFTGFRHGYAGTVYKSQGKTLDKAFILHSEHMRASSSYVALTRHKAELMVFADRQTSPDVAAMARSMGRDDQKPASIHWREGSPRALDSLRQAAKVLEQVQEQARTLKPEVTQAERDAAREYWITVQRQAPKHQHRPQQHHEHRLRGPSLGR